MCQKSNLDLNELEDKAGKWIVHLGEGANTQAVPYARRTFI
jgi:hypothetical protein